MPDSDICSDHLKLDHTWRDAGENKEYEINVYWKLRRKFSHKIKVKREKNYFLKAYFKNIIFT